MFFSSLDNKKLMDTTHIKEKTTLFSAVSINERLNVSIFLTTLIAVSQPGPVVTSFKF